MGDGSHLLHHYHEVWFVKEKWKGFAFLNFFFFCDKYNTNNINTGECGSEKCSHLNFNLGSSFWVKGNDNEKHPKQWFSPILSVVCLFYPMSSFAHCTDFAALSWKRLFCLPLFHHGWHLHLSFSFNRASPAPLNIKWHEGYLISTKSKGAGYFQSDPTNRPSTTGNSSTTLALIPGGPLLHWHKWMGSSTSTSPGPVLLPWCIRPLRLSIWPKGNEKNCPLLASSAFGRYKNIKHNFKNEKEDGLRCHQLLRCRFQVRFHLSNLLHKSSYRRQGSSPCRRAASCFLKRSRCWAAHLGWLILPQPRQWGNKWEESGVQPPPTAQRIEPSLLQPKSEGLSLSISQMNSFSVVVNFLFPCGFLFVMGFTSLL